MIHELSLQNICTAENLHCFKNLGNFQAEKTRIRVGDEKLNACVVTYITFTRARRRTIFAIIFAFSFRTKCQILNETLSRLNITPHKLIDFSMHKDFRSIAYRIYFSYLFKSQNLNYPEPVVNEVRKLKMISNC